VVPTSDEPQAQWMESVSNLAMKSYNRPKESKRITRSQRHQRRGRQFQATAHIP
jgi:hypothetical protein